MKNKNVLPFWRRKDFYVPFGIFILALIIRLHFWPAGLFHTDSVITAMEAERTVNEGRLYYLQGDLGYPGYAIISSSLYLFFHVFFDYGSSSSILIWSSMIFGSLSAVTMYLMSKYFLKSDTAAICSSLIIVFMPLHLSLSTYVKDQMVGSIFMMASLMLAYYAGQKNTFKTKLMAAFVMGYTVTIRQQEFLLLPAFLLTYLWGSDLKLIRKTKSGISLKIKEIKSYIIDCFILAVPSPIIFYLSFIPRMMYEPHYSVVDSFLKGGGQQLGSYNLLSPVMTTFSIPWAILNLTYLGVFILIYAVFIHYRTDFKLWLAFSAWMFPYFFIIGNFVQVSPYFIFPAFIPAAFFMGWGIDDLAKKYSNKLPAVLTAIICIWMILNIYDVLSYRASYCGPCEFSKKIGVVTPVKSYVGGMDETRHYEYYALRRPPPRGRPNVLDGGDVESYLVFLESLMQNGTSIYVTTMDLSSDYMDSRVLAQHPTNPSVIVNRATQRIYPNVIYDGDNRLFRDRETLNPLPVRGLYGLELANRFIITEVFSIENEDWHHKGLDPGKYTSTLYHLTKRITSS